MRYAKFQWIIFIMVFLSILFLLNKITESSIININNVTVKGQGNAHIVESTLANMKNMPLVSIEKSELIVATSSIDHGIDESLFYEINSEKTKKESFISEVVKPEFNVAAEVKSGIRLSAVFSNGAIINKKFVTKGDVVATVKNTRGEPTKATLTQIGANYVIVTAAGHNVRIDI